jgi:hypothetical protein
VHAIAAQQKAVVQRHRLRGVVQSHLCLHAQRAGERVRAAARFMAHMIDGQAGQPVAAEPVSARIPDMQQMGDPATQHQGREGAAQSRKVGVLAAHGVDPAVQRTDDVSPGALDLHRFRQIAKAVEEAAHRGLGRDTAALRAADPIGDRRDHFPARLGQLRADQRAGEILVVPTWPGLRSKPDACLYAEFSRRHDTASARSSAARIATRR